MLSFVVIKYSYNCVYTTFLKRYLLLLSITLRMHWWRRWWWWLLSLTLMRHSRRAHRHRYHRIHDNRCRHRQRWRYELRNRRWWWWYPFLFLVVVGPVPAAQKPILFHPHIFPDGFARHVSPSFQHRLRVRFRFAVLFLHSWWRWWDARLFHSFPVFYAEFNRPFRFLLR